MTATAFETILVANRGEIASRVIRTARALGYRTVAVFSDEDRDAPFVAQADIAVAIGGPAPAQSYANADAIISAARRSGADAVHPGYGFLSENAEFARACAAAGLVFIGPPAEAIALMGNKAAAKRLMAEAGVPCIPGYQGETQDDETLIEQARLIGAPIMVKAAAGGGGRGMRLVNNLADLASALAAARSEALASFQSDELILERAVIRPRHVEIQVFADRHGNVIHLGERDCSVQRRHQKVIEESPCPVLDDAQRARMGAAAVAAARAVDYIGAGTVEFLLDDAGNFYFMEMNTRLQVEHPVTELVTGLDLVELQLKVAAGAPLPLTQAEVRLAGHAIEARLYAEDPADDFAPQTGRILAWQPPTGPGVRVDSGIAAGFEVSPYYDAMLAKVLAWGADRAEARRRLLRALEDCRVQGVATNRAFLTACLADMEFAAGAATTAFLTERTGCFASVTPDEAFAIAAAVLATAGAPDAIVGTPYPMPFKLAIGENTCELRVSRDLNGRCRVEGLAVPVEIGLRGPVDDLRYAIDGVWRRASVALSGDEVHVSTAAGDWVVRDLTWQPAQNGGGDSDGRVRAMTTGTVTSVRVALDDPVRRGDPLLVLEAMKMEHEVRAPVDGIVRVLHAAPGKQVARHAVLVEVEPTE